FEQVKPDFHRFIRSFDWSVKISYDQWITLFSYDHVLTLNNSGSKTSMLQDSADSIEMFLEEFFRGILEPTESETRIKQIVGDLILCMDEFLSCLAIEQGQKDKQQSARDIGLVGMNTQEGWTSKLFPEDWQYAWKQPFRGKSLMLLKQKLALNVDALQQARRPSSRGFSKLEMSRIIPIVQSSGTGKSRLAEEYHSPGMFC